MKKVSTKAVNKPSTVQPSQDRHVKKTNRICIFELKKDGKWLNQESKVPEKSGEGFPGLDLNSGWNWTPI